METKNAINLKTDLYTVYFIHLPIYSFMDKLQQFFLINDLCLLLSLSTLINYVRKHLITLFFLKRSSVFLLLHLTSTTDNKTLIKYKLCKYKYNHLFSGRFPMLVMVACSSTSSIISLAIFILPPTAVAGLFRVGLLADIVNREPEMFMCTISKYLGTIWWNIWLAMWTVLICNADRLQRWRVYYG